MKIKPLKIEYIIPKGKGEVRYAIEITEDLVTIIYKNEEHIYIRKKE